MIRTIDLIEDEKSKELAAKTVLAYNSRNLKYDSPKDEFYVENQVEGPAKNMVRDALLALGAKETNGPDGPGRVIVYSENGARNVATKLKEFGVNFKGAADLPAREASR